MIAQVPIYPVADDVSQHKSFFDFGEGYFLTATSMAWFNGQYAPDPMDHRNLPLLGDCSLTPPTVLCTAGLDPLRDSGRAYAGHAISQGADVTYLEFKGTIHGFITLRKAIPSGQDDLTRLLGAVKYMLDGLDHAPT